MSSRFYCEKSSAACIDRWKKRCAQAPSTGSADPQTTAMEHRNDAARVSPYLQPSCTCQVGVGRVQLQRIAVETTLRGAARSRQLPTAARVVWEHAMCCRGQTQCPQSACRASWPSRHHRRQRAHEGVITARACVVVAHAVLCCKSRDSPLLRPRRTASATEIVRKSIESSPARV